MWFWLWWRESWLLLWLYCWGLKTVNCELYQKYQVKRNWREKRRRFETWDLRFQVGVDCWLDLIVCDNWLVIFHFFSSQFSILSSQFLILYSYLIWFDVMWSDIYCLCLFSCAGSKARFGGAHAESYGIFMGLQILYLIVMLMPHASWFPVLISWKKV